MFTKTSIDAAVLPRRYYVTLTAASTALWTAMVGPLLVLLPQQVELAAGDDSVGAYTLVATAGGLVGILINPVAGRLSDRTTSRFGRRRPWIAGSATGAAVALTLLGQAADVPSLLAGWTAFTVFATFALTTLTATIPDRVPESRRGSATAGLGASWALAPVLGTGLAALFDQNPAATYAAIALFLAIACGVFVMSTPDVPVDPEQRQIRRLRGMFWVNPRRHPDFAYAWLTRFCFALGQNMATAFLFFFLDDILRASSDHAGLTTTEALAIVTLVYAVAAVGAAVGGGITSDRLARRKIFVLFAALLFASGTALGAVLPTWSGVLLLAVLTGIGFGAFEAADMALVTQVLPVRADRAKDLGLINLATTLGITLGPVASAPLLELGGYTALYLTAGAVALLSAAFVHPIRGVR